MSKKNTKKLLFTHILFTFHYTIYILHTGLVSNLHLPYILIVTFRRHIFVIENDLIVVKPYF